MGQEQCKKEAKQQQHWNDRLVGDTLRGTNKLFCVLERNMGQAGSTDFRQVATAFDDCKPVTV